LWGICIALQNSGKVGKSLQRGTPGSRPLHSNYQHNRRC